MRLWLVQLVCEANVSAQEEPNGIKKLMMLRSLYVIHPQVGIYSERRWLILAEMF